MAQPNNRDIAINRLQHTFNTSIDILFNRTKNHKYDGFVLAFGGDLLSGNIHEELAETNEDSVMRLIGTIWSITQIRPENEPLLQKAADSLGELGKGAAEYRLLCTADIVEALGELGRIAIDRKYSWTARSIAESLGEIRKLGVVYNLLLAERRAEIYLRDLGEKAN